MLYLVAMREVSVKMTIERLQAKNIPVSFQSICDHLLCSESTVQRAIKNLIASGELVRTGTPRSGYTYTLLGDDDAKSA